MALTVRRVLVLRALGLGDFLTGVPAYRALRRSYPHAVHTLAAPAWLEPLVGLTGAVDQLLPTPGLGQLRWRGRPPDVAVNLHGVGPQSTSDLLRTGSRCLLSHAPPDRPRVVGPSWDPEVHEIDRWCRLLEWYQIPADRRDLRLGRPDGPPVRSGAVVIHPGASTAARRWPAERFAAVARHLAAQGHEVVVTGSAAELGLATRVAHAAGLAPSAVLAGRLDLLQLAGLVAAALLVVANDTGVAHLASAYATPSVVIFGPVSPRVWGPPTGGPHSAVWTGRAGNGLAGVPDTALRRLPVQSVLAAVGARLAASTATHRATAPLS